MAQIIGSAGDDTRDGGADNDRIHGLTGGDILQGGDDGDGVADFVLALNGHLSETSGWLL